MGVLSLRHKENILYREDELSDRIKLLYRWVSEDNLSLDEFEVLLKSCNEKQVELDKQRRYNERV